MNSLILFYLGSHPDNRGRTLSKILRQDDLWFEVTHDYIQWLFPNEERSRISAGAPTITSEVKSEFEGDDLLQRHLRASFYRILAFYGLTITDGLVAKSDKWEDRKLNWFIEDTHNNLRITRILKCLCALGLKTEALQFHDALVKLVTEEKDSGIGGVAQKFWAEAVGRECIN